MLPNEESGCGFSSYNLLMTRALFNKFPFYPLEDLNCQNTLKRTKGFIDFKRLMVNGRLESKWFISGKSWSTFHCELIIIVCYYRQAIRVIGEKTRPRGIVELSFWFDQENNKRILFLIDKKDFNKQQKMLLPSKDTSGQRSSVISLYRSLLNNFSKLIKLSFWEVLTP